MICYGVCFLRRFVYLQTSSAHNQDEQRAQEWWLADLAERLRLSVHTLHSWRRRGWIAARQPTGRRGPWIAWADDDELTRLHRYNSRATKRFSGSTAWYCRAARSAS